MILMMIFDRFPGKLDFSAAAWMDPKSCPNEGMRRVIATNCRHVGDDAAQGKHVAVVRQWSTALGLLSVELGMEP